MPGNQIVQSLARGCDILELVAKSEDGLGLDRIASALGLAAPTAHNLARTLVARGFLEKTARPPRYRLGAAALALAEAHAQGALTSRAERLLRDHVPAEPGGCVILAESLGGDIVTTLSLRHEKPRLLERPIGRHLHPYGSASALLFQAFWGEEARLAFVERHPFWEHGAHIWGTEEALGEFLEQVRQAGYADLRVVSGELRVVAAPIVSHRHELLAAIGLSVPVRNATDAVWRRRVTEVCEMASELSSAM